ncbi:type VI secretion system baseplate subunit TssE [Fulvimarina sp. MAC8]|uniref:type VI secretion system baseplate subunit TssE n=1 Tax=Fulvimarina sp. MAC8 TaxID=3162874 RepID=UPI0032EEB00A
MAIDPLRRFAADSVTVHQPLLDRLIDEEPARVEDPPRRPVDEVRTLREAIRRDLEGLLNTRRPLVDAKVLKDGLETSLVGYGIDGFVGANLASDVAKQKFARSIERRIEMFETRLEKVRVTILKNRSEEERALRMRIEANFRVHAGMPPIRLESVIDPSTLSIAIEAPNG